MSQTQLQQPGSGLQTAAGKKLDINQFANTTVILLCRQNKGRIDKGLRLGLESSIDEAISYIWRARSQSSYAAVLGICQKKPS